MLLPATSQADGGLNSAGNDPTKTQVNTGEPQPGNRLLYYQERNILQCSGTTNRQEDAKAILEPHLDPDSQKGLKKRYHGQTLRGAENEGEPVLLVKIGRHSIYLPKKDLVRVKFGQLQVFITKFLGDSLSVWASGSIVVDKQNWTKLVNEGHSFSVTVSIRGGMEAAPQDNDLSSSYRLRIIHEGAVKSAIEMVKSEQNPVDKSAITTRVTSLHRTLLTEFNNCKTDAERQQFFSKRRDEIAILSKTQFRRFTNAGLVLLASTCEASNSLQFIPIKFVEGTSGHLTPPNLQKVSLGPNGQVHGCQPVLSGNVSNTHPFLASVQASEMLVECLISSNDSPPDDKVLKSALLCQTGRSQWRHFTALDGTQGSNKCPELFGVKAIGEFKGHTHLLVWMPLSAKVHGVTEQLNDNYTVQLPLCGASPLWAQLIDIVSEIEPNTITLIPVDHHTCYFKGRCGLKNASLPYTQHLTTLPMSFSPIDEKYRTLMEHLFDYRELVKALGHWLDLSQVDDGLHTIWRELLGVLQAALGTHGDQQIETLQMEFTKLHVRTKFTDFTIAVLLKEMLFVAATGCLIVNSIPFNLFGILFGDQGSVTNRIEMLESSIAQVISSNMGVYVINVEVIFFPQPGSPTKVVENNNGNGTYTVYSLEEDDKTRSKWKEVSKGLPLKTVKKAPNTSMLYKPGPGACDHRDPLNEGASDRKLMDNTTWQGTLHPLVLANMLDRCNFIFELLSSIAQEHGFTIPGLLEGAKELVSIMVNDRCPSGVLHIIYHWYETVFQPLLRHYFAAVWNKLPEELTTLVNYLGHVHILQSIVSEPFCDELEQETDVLANLRMALTNHPSDYVKQIAPRMTIWQVVAGIVMIVQVSKSVLMKPDGFQSLVDTVLGVSSNLTPDDLDKSSNSTLQLLMHDQSLTPDDFYPAIVNVYGRSIFQSLKAGSRSWPSRNALFYHFNSYDPKNEGSYIFAHSSKKRKVTGGSKESLEDIVKRAMSPEAIHDIYSLVAKHGSEKGQEFAKQVLYNECLIVTKAIAAERLNEVTGEVKGCGLQKTKENEFMEHLDTISKFIDSNPKDCVVLAYAVLCHAQGCKHTQSMETGDPIQSNLHQVLMSAEPLVPPRSTNLFQTAAKLMKGDRCFFTKFSEVLGEHVDYAKLLSLEQLQTKLLKRLQHHCKFLGRWSTVYLQKVRIAATISNQKIQGLRKFLMQIDPACMNMVLETFGENALDLIYSPADSDDVTVSIELQTFPTVATVSYECLGRHIHSNRHEFGVMGNIQAASLMCLTGQLSYPSTHGNVKKLIFECLSGVLVELEAFDTLDLQMYIDKSQLDMFIHGFAYDMAACILYVVAAQVASYYCTSEQMTDSCHRTAKAAKTREDRYWKSVILGLFMLVLENSTPDEKKLLMRRSMISTCQYHHADPVEWLVHCNKWSRPQVKRIAQSLTVYLNPDLTPQKACDAYCIMFAVYALGACSAVLKKESAVVVAYYMHFLQHVRCCFMTVAAVLEGSWTKHQLRKTLLQVLSKWLRTLSDQLRELLNAVQGAETESFFVNFEEVIKVFTDWIDTSSGVPQCYTVNVQQAASTPFGKIADVITTLYTNVACDPSVCVYIGYLLESLLEQLLFQVAAAVCNFDANTKTAVASNMRNSMRSLDPFMQRLLVVSMILRQFLGESTSELGQSALSFVHRWYERHIELLTCIDNVKLNEGRSIKALLSMLLCQCEDHQFMGLPVRKYVLERAPGYMIELILDSGNNSQVIIQGHLEDKMNTRRADLRKPFDFLDSSSFFKLLQMLRVYLQTYPRHNLSFTILTKSVTQWLDFLQDAPCLSRTTIRTILDFLSGVDKPRFYGTPTPNSDCEPHAVSAAITKLFDTPEGPPEVPRQSSDELDSSWSNFARQLDYDLNALIPLDGNPLDGNPLDGNPLDDNPLDSVFADWFSDMMKNQDVPVAPTSTNDTLEASNARHVPLVPISGMNLLDVGVEGQGQMEVDLPSPQRDV
jgi:hypothetical protein